MALAPLWKILDQPLIAFMLLPLSYPATGSASVQRHKKTKTLRFIFIHRTLSDPDRSVLIQNWMCLSIICKKLHENEERNWTGGVHPLCYHLDPPMNREPYTLCQPSRSSTSVMFTFIPLTCYVTRLFSQLFLSVIVPNFIVIRRYLFSLNG